MGHSPWIYPITSIMLQVQGPLGYQLMSGQTPYSHSLGLRLGWRPFIEPHDTFYTSPHAMLDGAGHDMQEGGVPRVVGRGVPRVV